MTAATDRPTTCSCCGWRRRHVHHASGRCEACYNCCPATGGCAGTRPRRALVEDDLEQAVSHTAEGQYAHANLTNREALDRGLRMAGIASLPSHQRNAVRDQAMSRVWAWMQHDDDLAPANQGDHR